MYWTSVTDHTVVFVTECIIPTKHVYIVDHNFYFEHTDWPLLCVKKLSFKKNRDKVHDIFPYKASIYQKLIYLCSLDI